MIDIVELTKRLGMPDSEQDAVMSWTGAPLGTTWTEVEVAELIEIWNRGDGYTSPSELTKTDFDAPRSFSDLLDAYGLAKYNHGGALHSGATVRVTSNYMIEADTLRAEIIKRFGNSLA